MVEERKRGFQETDLKDSGLVRRRRSRKVMGEEGSKKQVVIMFVLILLMSLGFYLPNELKQWWQKFNQPEVITIERPVGNTKDVSQVVGFKVTINERADVVEVVEKLLVDLTGDYGVFVEKLEGSGGFGFNEKKVLAAASVIKLPILVAYYQAVDEGSLDEGEIYVLKEADRFEYGTGSMQNQPVGTEYSYKEIASLTANQSDNMGAQLLVKFLGRERKVQDRITSWGLKETDVGGITTTAEEMGELLKRLYQGELISKESKEELFNNLTGTILEDRIPAGVPTGVRVVHKFGSETGIVNDCGIVLGEGFYVICILSTGVNDGEAQEVLPKISRVVWEWAGK